MRIQLTLNDERARVLLTLFQAVRDELPFWEAPYFTEAELWILRLILTEFHALRAEFPDLWDDVEKGKVRT